MNATEHFNKSSHSILAVGFEEGEVERLLGRGGQYQYVADPEFSLGTRNWNEFMAAVIRQSQVINGGPLRARYLMRLSRHMPLIAFVDEEELIEGRRCVYGIEAIAFRRTKDLMPEICALGQEGYWLLPGDMDGAALLMGCSAAKLWRRLGTEDVRFLRHLEEGLGNAKIAELEGLSDGDVKMRLLEIFRILGVATRTQAAIVSFFLRSRLEGTAHRDTDQ